MAEDKTTATVDDKTGTPPNKDSGDKDVDWQKRYKDEQAELTRLQQKVSEQEQLFEGISDFVDWDALQKGGAKPKETEDGFVDKNEFNKFKKDIEGYRQRNEMTQQWRQDNKDDPNMLAHEFLVGAYFRDKTDPRKPFAARLADATKSVKELLDHQQGLGVTNKEKTEKAKAAKEAETAGLDSSKTAPEKGAPTGETPQDYVDSLRAAQEKSKLTNF